MFSRQIYHVWIHLAEQFWWYKFELQNIAKYSVLGPQTQCLKFNFRKSFDNYKIGVTTIKKFFIFTFIMHIEIKSSNFENFSKSLKHIKNLTEIINIVAIFKEKIFFISWNILKEERKYNNNNIMNKFYDKLEILDLHVL